VRLSPQAIQRLQATRGYCVLKDRTATEVFHSPLCRAVLREHPGRYDTVLTRPSGKRPCRFCGG
jgi:hypothetical protein